jgi:hypothetical protein
MIFRGIHDLGSILKITLNVSLGRVSTLKTSRAIEKLY